MSKRPSTTILSFYSPRSKKSDSAETTDAGRSDKECSSEKVGGAVVTDDSSGAQKNSEISIEAREKDLHCSDNNAAVGGSESQGEHSTSSEDESENENDENDESSKEQLPECSKNSSEGPKETEQKEDSYLVATGRKVKGRTKYRCKVCYEMKETVAKQYGYRGKLPGICTKKGIILRKKIKDRAFCIQNTCRIDKGTQH